MQAKSAGRGAGKGRVFFTAESTGRHGEESCRGRAAEKDAFGPLGPPGLEDVRKSRQACRTERRPLAGSGKTPFACSCRRGGIDLLTASSPGSGRVWSVRTNSAPSRVAYSLLCVLGGEITLRMRTMHIRCRATFPIRGVPRMGPLGGPAVQADWSVSISSHPPRPAADTSQPADAGARAELEAVKSRRKG